jgi:hypothetical protein
MRLGMIKLRAFPRNRLIEEPLCRLRTSELSLYQSLGNPTGMTDPIDANPQLYWDLEWSCGLVMSLAFHQLTERLELSLDQPEVSHALRHLSVEAFDLRLLRIDDPVRFAQVTTVADATWDLWRIQPDGREQHFKRGLNRRDADCWAREAEAATGWRHWVVSTA